MKISNEKINIRDITILLSVTYIILTIGSIISQNVLLRLFDLEASIFFNLTDYLSSSLIYIFIFSLALLYLIIIERLFEKFIIKNNAHKRLATIFKANPKTRIIINILILFLIPILIGGMMYITKLTTELLIIFLFCVIASILYVYGKQKLQGQTIVENKKSQKKILISAMIITILFFLGMAGISMVKATYIKNNAQNCNYNFFLEQETLNNLCIITKSNKYFITYSSYKNVMVIQESNIKKIEKR